MTNVSEFPPPTPKSGKLANPAEQYYQYFRQRGLDDADVANLGVQHLFDDQLISALPNLNHAVQWVANGGSGAKIPYVDRHGQVTDAYVVRLLGEQPSFLKIPKALYPPKRRPRAHFPRSNPKLSKGDVVFLCESVIKAEIVAKCGFYAIGINGCWGYSDKNTSDLLISDIRDLPWELISQVRVFYDSNYSTNDHVKLAATKFALRLKQVINYSNTLITVLPPAADGTDWGCDDAFMAHGKDWLIDLLEGEAIAPELTEFDVKLMEMNDIVCIVQSTARIYRHDLDNIIEYTFSDLHNMFKNWTLMGEQPNKDPKKTAVSRLWEQWDKRNEVKSIEMVPYGPKIEPGQFLNCWFDPKVEAKLPSPIWTEFMDNFIEDEVSKTWLNQWIASLVQNPGVKLHTYPVLVGPPGTGKTMITSMIESMLGKPNCALIGQEDIENTFNGHYAEKMFVGINEFERRYHDRTGIGDKMKRMVTETTTIANGKHIKIRAVKAMANYMITTNNLNALKLEEGDRRAGVVDCTPIVSHYGDVKYFAPLWKLIATDPGAILGYYLSVDMQGFSPFGNAPVTEAKREMTESTRSPVETLAWRMINEKEAFLAELKLPTDICYVSGTLLLGDNRILNELGITDMNFNSKRQLQYLGQALIGAGAPTLQNKDGGRVGVRGVKHKVYVLPGGHKYAENEEVLIDLAKWTNTASKIGPR